MAKKEYEMVDFTLSDLPEKKTFKGLLLFKDGSTEQARFVKTLPNMLFIFKNQNTGISGIGAVIKNDTALYNIKTMYGLILSSRKIVGVSVQKEKNKKDL